MKCTKFFELIKNIKNLEAKELKKALLAHGGHYEFPRRDNNGWPITPVICINHNKLGLLEIFVYSAHYDAKSNHISINGQDSGSLEEMTVNLDDVLAGELENLINLIPETDTLDSVKTTAIGDIAVDPEIVFALTTDVYPALVKSGFDYLASFLEIRKKAEELTTKYSDYNWDQNDFVQVMEDESEQMIKELIHPKILSSLQDYLDNFEGPVDRDLTKNILKDILNGLNTKKELLKVYGEGAERAIGILFWGRYIKEKQVNDDDIVFEPRYDFMPDEREFRLLRGVNGWNLDALLSVKRLSLMKLTPDAVRAVCDLKEMIDKEAHAYLVNFMRDFATCHPGRPKIYLDLDDGVSAYLDDKYCSYQGRIIAVSFIDGGLHYDIQTGTDLEKDVPDYRDVSRCGIFVENETILLKTILNTVETPYYPEDEDFFDFIKRGAEVRWNDMPEYITRMKKPGPLVKVIGIHEFDEEGGPVDENTPIRIKTDEEEPVIIVKAKELEPA